MQTVVRGDELLAGGGELLGVGLVAVEELVEDRELTLGGLQIALGPLDVSELGGDSAFVIGLGGQRPREYPEEQRPPKHHLQTQRRAPE